MTVTSLLLVREDTARRRALALAYLLQRRRLVRERRARTWRLWQIVEQQSPFAGVAA